MPVLFLHTKSFRFKYTKTFRFKKFLFFKLFCILYMKDKEEEKKTTELAGVDSDENE